MTTDVIISPGTDLPVTLQELKDHCRVYDYTEEDAILTLYLKAAVERVEAIAGYALKQSTARLTLTEYCNTEFRFQPIVSIQDVTHTLETVDTVLVADVDYTLTEKNGLTVFSVADAFKTANGSLDSLVVNYTTGYTSTTCPSVLKVAILLIAGDMYNNREDSPSTRVMSAAERLIQTDRRSFL